MFRPGFGVLAVLLGFVLLLPQAARTGNAGAHAERSVEASAVGVASTTASDGQAALARPVPTSDSSTIVQERRDRRSVSEPSTLLLMGLVLFGAAHFARRPTQTNR